MGNDLVWKGHFKNRKLGDLRVLLFRIFSGEAFLHSAKTREIFPGHLGRELCSIIQSQYPCRSLRYVDGGRFVQIDVSCNSDYLALTLSGSTSLENELAEVFRYLKELHLSARAVPLSENSPNALLFSYIEELEVEIARNFVNNSCSRSCYVPQAVFKTKRGK